MNHFAAFNKSIADELGKRLPEHVESRTIHSLGYGALRSAFPNIRKWDLDNGKNKYRYMVRDYIERLKATGATILAEAEFADGVGAVLMQATPLGGNHVRLISYDLDEAQHEGAECVISIQSWKAENINAARAEWRKVIHQMNGESSLPESPTKESIGNDFDARLSTNEEVATLDCGCILKWEENSGDALFIFCASHNSVQIVK